MTNSKKSSPTTTTAAPHPLDDICKFLDRFVVFPSQEARDVTALWITHTWAFDAAYTTPYLYVNAPERESGKTRLMETCALLTRNSKMSSNLSGASMFRVIEATRPTLFIDEVDTVFTGADNKELRNILNSGYKHNGTVDRVDPKGSEETGGVVTYSTFSPKMLAGIDNGGMPEATASRCIFINMRRRKDSDPQVERMMERKMEAMVKPLREAIEIWVMENMDHLMDAEPKIMENLGDRAWDIAEPLVAIAERAKGWGPRARKALTTLLVKDEGRKLTEGGKVLEAAREVFEHMNAKRIPSSILADKLDMTPKRVGVLLAPYGIRPRTLRIGSNQAKGFDRADFTDAWERYL